VVIRMPGVSVSKVAYAAMKAFTPQESAVSHSLPQDKTQPPTPQFLAVFDDIPTLADFPSFFKGDGDAVKDKEIVSFKAPEEQMTRPAGRTPIPHMRERCSSFDSNDTDPDMPELVPVDSGQAPAQRDKIAAPVERDIQLRPKNVARLGGVVAQGSAISVIQSVSLGLVILL